MVNRSICLLLALSLVGCLSKPGAPSEQIGDGGPGDGAPGDGAVDTPPPPPCDNTNSFPANFTLDGPAKVLDVNGDGNDDFVIYGHVEGGGASSAYLMFGRDDLDLACFDREYTLESGFAVLDVWLGDLVGDGSPELILLGASSGSDDYLVRMFGGSDAGPVATFSSGRWVGGKGETSISIPPPRFVIGLKRAMKTIMIGGVNDPFAMLAVNDTGTVSISNAVKAENQTGGGNFSFAASSPQQVWTHIGATTASEIHVIAATANALRAAIPVSASTLDLRSQSVTLSVGQGYARPWHRVLADNTSTAVVKGSNRYYIATYDDELALAASEIADTDDAGDTEVDPLDLGLGQLGEATGDALDLVVLRDGSGSFPNKLIVHPDLAVGQADVDPNASLGVTLDHGYLVAVGNFSRKAGMEGDEILVLDHLITGTLGTCHRVSNGTIEPCP